jgi:chorismate mutase/prephenate dehydratase
MSIDDQRKELDDIDDQILKLLRARIEVAQHVAFEKKEDGRRLRDRKREAELLARLQQGAEEAGLPVDAVTRIYQEVLNLSFQEQISIFSGSQASSQKVRIGYQGVPGAYSQWAGKRVGSARKWNTETVGCHTFKAVAEAVVDGQVEFGILPVENTVAGSINDTYDLLQKYALYIVGEEAVPIAHCLAAPKRVPLTDIERVYSHPQALAQCSTFLEELSGTEVHSYFDTAAAMKKVADEGDVKSAAIAGTLAAEMYGLVVLKYQIANRPENLTRFLLVSTDKQTVPVGVAAKTSIILTVRHEEGALLHALSTMHKFKVNLTKLESRPRPGAPWQYYFYIDFEGNEADPHVAEMLQLLESSAQELRVLGSYVSRTVSEGRPVSPEEIRDSERP